VRPLGSGEREGRNQPPPGYSRQFPTLTRGRTKMEVERSSLDNFIEEIVREGGCNKRKAGLVETDLNKME
jgi:hypothetical protein